jgi:hypothetical protein
MIARHKDSTLDCVLLPWKLYVMHHQIQLNLFLSTYLHLPSLEVLYPSVPRPAKRVSIENIHSWIGSHRNQKTPMRVGKVYHEVAEHCVALSGQIPSSDASPFFPSVQFPSRDPVALI